MRRGDKARDRHDWASAARYYRRALVLNPTLGAIWVQYGHALKEVGERRAAERAYRSALAQQGGVADTHLHLGHLLKIEHRLPEATGEYFAAALLDPGMTAAHQELSALGYAVKSETARQRKPVEEELAASRRALELAELQLYTLRSDYQRAVNHNSVLSANVRAAERHAEELARINDALRVDLAEAEAELRGRTKSMPSAGQPC